MKPHLDLQPSSLIAAPTRKHRHQKKALILTSCFLWGCLAAAPSLFAQTWNGLGPDDFWFTNSNWNTNLAPNGITVNVSVGAPSPTIINNNVNINSLNVTSAGIVTLNGLLSLEFGGTAPTTLTNAGTINVLGFASLQLARNVNNSGSLNLTGTNGELRVISAGATLNGGGTISLSNSGIRSVSGTSTLTIANQTLRGTGAIGLNTLGIINQADSLIDANSAAATLTIDPSSAGMTNDGTLRASGGGDLRLMDGTFTGGGLIQAQSTSAVSMIELIDARIVGQTLSTTGTGLIRVNNSSESALENVQFSGNMEVRNGAELEIKGALNNSGFISINNTGAETDILIPSGVTNLDGLGTINLQGSLELSSRIRAVSGNPTLNLVGQTIQGHGELGDNSIRIINSPISLIHANVSGERLRIDPNSAGMDNQGIMRASNGGILQLVGAGVGGGDFNNTGGTIQAQNGSIVRLANATVSGGTLSTSGTGLISVDAGTTSTLIDMTISGNLKILNGATLRNQGNLIQNTGNLTLDNGTLSSAYLATAGVIEGNGTITGGFTFNGTAKLDPGFSPGQLNFGANLTWGAGGSILFDLGLDQLSSDLIDVTGDLLKSGAGSFQFTFVDNGWVVGNTYDLIQFNSTNFNLTDFSYTNTSGFAGNFAFSGGNTLQFTMTAIPEPGSAIVFAVAGLLMVSRRRRESDRRDQPLNCLVPRPGSILNGGFYDLSCSQWRLL